MDLTLKQHDIAETLRRQYDYIEKLAAIRFVKSVFGSTASIRDIITAYNSIDQYKF